MRLYPARHAPLPEQNGAFLLDIFDAFCCRLKEAREQALTLTSTNATANTVEQLWRGLYEFLDAIEAQEQPAEGTFIDLNLRETLYVMVAIADECFMSLDWHGRVYWKDHRFEQVFFGTSSAPEEIFRRIERFLENRSPLFVELSVIYLKALALGLRGKHACANDDHILARYRQRLYDYLSAHDPSTALSEGKIFKQGYHYTFSTAATRPFADRRLWGYAFYLLGVAIILASSWMWSRETRTLQDLTKHIDGVEGDYYDVVE